MPQTVEIEGFGHVEFPDEATNDDIVQAAAQFEAQSQKRSKLKVEQETARKEIGPITEWFARDVGISPTQEQAAGMVSPIGFPRMVRPYTPSPTEPPIVQGIREAGRTIAELPTGMTTPTMLPLLPLAALPIPGGPAMRHVIPKAMGILFGGQSLGHGAADIVGGIEAQDPRQIGRGAGEVVIGGSMAAPVVAGGVKPLLLPRSLAAAREAGVEVPETVASSASPISTIGEVPPKAERLPRGQQVLAQEPLAGEFRVKEDSVRTEIEAAEAKATTEIAEAWKQMTEAEKDNARHGRGIPKRFGGRAPDIGETGEPPLPAAPAPTPTPPLPVVAPPMQLPTAHGAPPAEQKPPESIGGPSAIQEPEAGELLSDVRPPTGEGAEGVPTKSGAEGVRAGAETAQRPEVPIRTPEQKRQDIEEELAGYPPEEVAKIRKRLESLGIIEPRQEVPAAPPTEPRPAVPAEAPKAAPVTVEPVEPSENLKVTVGQEVWDGYHNRSGVVTAITTGQVKVRLSNGNEVWIKAEAVGPKRGPAVAPVIDVEGKTVEPKQISEAAPEAKYPNKGVGSPADEFGAIYGPKLSPEMQSRFSEQIGESFDLPSPQGTTTTLKVKRNMLWMEVNRRVPGPGNEYEVGVAYMHIRPNGETVLDASKHGRDIDQMAAKALTDFLNKTQGEKQAQVTPTAQLAAPEPSPVQPVEAKPPELMTPREYLAQAGEVEPMAALRQQYGEMQRAYRERKPINAEAADKYEPDIGGSTQTVGQWLMDRGYVKEGDRYVYKGKPVEAKPAEPTKPGPQAPAQPVEAAAKAQAEIPEPLKKIAYLATYEKGRFLHEARQRLTESERKEVSDWAVKNNIGDPMQPQTQEAFFMKLARYASEQEAKAAPPAKAQAEVPDWQMTERGRDVYKADLAAENAKDAAVVAAMKAAPSYPKLLAAYHRFERSLRGKSYDPSVIEKTPWKMLDASSGVMNAKSQMAKTLAALENAVFAETGLPRAKGSKTFRGDTGIDWDAVKAPTEPTPPAKPAAKEPWQMTRTDYLARETGYGEGHRPYPQLDAVHKEAVKQALREGKPVPTEVLADYPDLAKPAEPTVGEGPGAKTAGAPKYPAIQQLTDQLEATPKLGKNKRGYLEAIADTWARRADITTKAIARTRVATVNALRSLEGIRKATDIDRELGEYDYAIQYSSSASKRAGEAMKRQMRDVTDREAAAILIDSARIAKDPHNPAEVRQVIADGLALLPADTPKSVRAAMERALDPSLELRQFSESLKQYFGIREQDAVDADLFSQGLEDYYTHVWEKESNMPNSLRDAIATGRVNTYFQFARQRKIPTLIEGILEGKKPVLDPAKVIPFYNFAMDRAIASRTFIKSLSDVMASDHTPGNPRPAVDVRGGATVVDPLDAKSDPAVLITPKTQAQNIRDYKVVNHPALQKWKWLTTTPEGRQVLMRGDLVVHPEFHTQLKRFMDRDVTTASKFTRRAMAISGTAKGLKLGLIPTTFHIAHVGAHAAFHWTNPFRWAPIDFEAPATRFAIEKGNLKLAPSPSELTLMAEGLGSSGLIRKIPYFGEWSGAFSDWMFHQYIPRLKLNTFENAMNRPVFGARSRFMSTGRALKAGRLTENDVAARAGDAVNNAFGELNHLFLGKVGRDPRFQRFLQLAFLAPDFGEARARFALKSFSRYGSEERLALATMGAALYFGARLGNYLSHGNMESDDWRHAFEVKVKDEKGKHHWLGMRSVVGDISHAIDRPGQFLYTRLNPLTSRPTTDFLYGREERTGRKLSFQERAVRAAQAFQPIGLGGLTEPDRTALESLGQSMGLANRRDMAVNDIARKAHDWLESIGRHPMSEIIPTDEPSYLKLRTAINIGKMGDAKTLLEGLLKTRSHKEIEKAMVNYLEHPYTGSKELEKQWATTFTKKDAQQYLDAQKEKMDTLMDFYKLLGATLKNP